MRGHQVTPTMRLAAWLSYLIKVSQLSRERSNETVERHYDRNRCRHSSVALDAMS